MEIRQPVAVDIDGVEREVGLEFPGATVQLTLDDEGMRYPITIDPTVDVDIGTGNDDVYIYATSVGGPATYFSKDTNYGFMGRYYGFCYSTGHRFADVNVPQGSSIISATLEFTGYWTYTGTPCNLKVSASDEDDAAQLTSTSDWNGRPRTSSVAWGGVPPWSAEENGPDTTSPNIASVIEAVVGRALWAANNAILLFTDADSGCAGTGVRACYQYEASAAKSADLHIEYGEEFVLGAAALAAEGTLTPKGVLSPGLMESSLSGDGALTCVGSVGALLLGQAALAGDGGLTAFGRLTPVIGGGNLDAEGTLTVVAVRIRTAAAALSAEGTLAARGEIGNILEGVASFSAEGALTVAAVRVRTAVAAFSADGAMAAGAVLAPGLMKASLAAEGTLEVIADVGVPITEPMTTAAWELDPTHYSTGTTFEIVVHVTASAPGGWTAYLYDVTAGGKIAASEITAGAGVTRAVSSPFSLNSGEHLYRVQYGGDAGIIYTPHGSALRVHAEPA